MLVDVADLPLIFILSRRENEAAVVFLLFVSISSGEMDETKASDCAQERSATGAVLPGSSRSPLATPRGGSGQVEIGCSSGATQVVAAPSLLTGLGDPSTESDMQLPEDLLKTVSGDGAGEQIDAFLLEDDLGFVVVVEFDLRFHEDRATETGSATLLLVQSKNVVGVTELGS